MRHKVSGRKFDRDSSHRMAMFRNLVTDLLDYEKLGLPKPRQRKYRGWQRELSRWESATIWLPGERC